LRDRYLLQEKVSGGSMGVVYKALDRRLAEVESPQPNVAIKILSPALAEDGLALRALQQEAAKTRCLVHPNIVRFIDLDRDDDLYFLILEWLEGRTLADILDSRDSRSIDTEAAFRIVRQVGDALDYAHRCGIVHADVKPGNIMVMPNGDAKLFDFGVARVRQKRAESDFDPGVLGAITPAYSSLQVLGGEEPVAADDVFSLACLLYRLVAGYRVFGPRNAAEASQAGMQPQRPQGLDNDQWNALKKALAYARVTRYKSVREFLDALGHHVAEAPVDDTINIEAPERFGTSDDGSSPGKWIATIVVLLGLAAIGANQMGYLDPWLDQFRDGTGMVEVAAPESIVEEIVADPVVEASSTDEAPVEVPDEVIEPPRGEAVDSGTDAEEASGPAAAAYTEASVPAQPEEQDAGVAEADPAEAMPAPSLVDFSRLPPADAIVHIGRGGEPARASLVLREDGQPVVVDFIRDGNPDEPLALRLEEIAFTGGTSPWAAGQYALSNAGLVAFPAGQQRARITFRMASDPRREADQQSTLQLRPNNDAETQ
ncbi:MAG: protein kinase, partial [Planctomycetes bacterium]|nr:protein kinase [Planctomycetota bacterium]